MARLEPSAALPDVGSFEKQQCPFRCMFFIAGEHARVLHISPLLQIPGVSLGSWAIDLLHSWHYGPLSTYLTFVLRALLSTDIYKPGISVILDKEESDKLCLMALKAELWVHYKYRRSVDPEWSKKGSEAGGVANDKQNYLRLYSWWEEIHSETPGHTTNTISRV